VERDKGKKGKISKKRKKSKKKQSKKGKKKKDKDLTPDRTTEVSKALFTRCVARPKLEPFQTVPCDPKLAPYDPN
jgi:hypothetical protein